MDDEKELGRNAQALMSRIVEVGLHGHAPKDYAKHMVFAKRLLKKAPLEHWLEVVDALRGHVFPYTKGTPFDVFVVERKEATALASRDAGEEVDDEAMPWLRNGFANEQPMERPELGEEWE